MRKSLYFIFFLAVLVSIPPLTHAILAPRIETQTESFDGLLSSSDITVQAALDTLDDYTYQELDPLFLVSPAYGITSTNISNWSTAFGWGDHSVAGYLTELNARNWYVNVSGGTMTGALVIDNETSEPSLNLTDGSILTTGTGSFGHLLVTDYAGGSTRPIAWHPIDASNNYLDIGGAIRAGLEGGFSVVRAIDGANDYLNLSSSGVGLVNINLDSGAANGMRVFDGGSTHYLWLRDSSIMSTSQAISFGSNDIVSTGTGSFGTLSGNELYVSSVNSCSLLKTMSNGKVACADKRIDTKCTWIENPTAADDLQSIWTPNGFSVTITKIWCESDEDIYLDLQVDDGSPADVNGSDIVCGVGGTEDELLGGDTTMADGDRLDLAITSAGAGGDDDVDDDIPGVPKFLSVCWTVEYED